MSRQQGGLKMELNDQAQRMVISGTKHSWRPASSNAPHGSRLHTALFKIFTESHNGRGWKGPLWVI